MRFSELSCKQVVNVRDGSVIGKVVDCELVTKELCIDALFVAHSGNIINKIFPWFFPTDEVVIPMDAVVSIGADVILVKISCG